MGVGKVLIAKDCQNRQLTRSCNYYNLRTTGPDSVLAVSNIGSQLRGLINLGLNLSMMTVDAIDGIYGRLNLVLIVVLIVVSGFSRHSLGAESGRARAGRDGRICCLARPLSQARTGATIHRLIRYGYIRYLIS